MLTKVPIFNMLCRYVLDDHGDPKGFWDAPTMPHTCCSLGRGTQLSGHSSLVIWIGGLGVAPGGKWNDLQTANLSSNFYPSGMNQASFMRYCGPVDWRMCSFPFGRLASIIQSGGGGDVSHRGNLDPAQSQSGKFINPSST